MLKSIVKSEYQAPQAEVIEARVERGFQASSSPEHQPTNGTEPLGEGDEAIFS